MKHGVYPQVIFRPLRLAAALMALPLLAGAVWAGPLDAGDAAYGSGQYAEAATDYGQATAQTQGAEQAKAYYKQGNAYHKLGRPSDARQAYQQAQRIDPTLSFASSPQKFAQALARVGGGGAQGNLSSPGSTGRGNSSAALAGRDAAYQALTAGNVYIDPRVPGVNSQTLDQAAAQGRDNPHTLVKIAVIDQLPPRYKSAASYAGTLHHALALGKNGLVAVAWHGRGAGVGVASEGLSQEESAQLAQQYAPQIAADPNVGTAALAQAVASEINTKEYRGTSFLWIVFFIIVAIVVWLVVSATRRKRAQLGQMQAQIAPLRQYVLESIGYIDGYMGVLPKNNPDSDQARTLRQAASGKYDNATKILDRATEGSDMARAQGLLNAARQDVDNARKALDRALGGTQNIPGDDALRPEPLPETQAEVQAIPAQQRGASFFSSQPAPLSSLVPVTVTINGQSKQVLATPEEAEELRQGRMPQVRTFQVNGQQVPWYAYNQYDPYNDYWRYQNAGWGGFGGNIISTLVGAELLGDLFSPHYYGGGYSPFAYSTDNDYYRGYYDAQQSDRAAGYGFGDWGGQNAPDNAGGASFMNDNGPGYDNSDYGGGASFLGSGGYGGGDQS